MSVSVFDKEPEERNNGSMDLFIVFCYYFETFNLNFTCFFQFEIVRFLPIRPPTHPPRKFIDWYYVSFWEFSTWTNEAANAVAIGQFLERNEWHDNVIMTLNFCTFSSIFRAYFNADDYLNLSISGHKKEHFEKTCFKIVISIDLCWLRY